MFRRITGAVRRLPVLLVASGGLVLSAASAGAGAISAEAAYLADDGPTGDHSVDHRIRAVMANLTLAEKVGQMFVLQVNGDTATTTNPTRIPLLDVEADASASLRTGQPETPGNRGRIRPWLP